MTSSTVELNGSGSGAAGDRGQMNLTAFMWGDGNYDRLGWREPEAFPDAGGINFERWIEVARILEDAKFDMLFLADSLTPQGVDELESFCQTARSASFEPLTLISGLASVTKHLGLGATVSTTYTEPYNTARMLASVDRISHGRAAWNIVTSRRPENGDNFGIELVEHDERYRIAEEFVDVCIGLWETFDKDAFPMDKETGQFIDPSKIHLLNHKGQYYSVRGPLGIPRSDQDRPVLIQAGQSGPGKDLGARVADCIFTSQGAGIEDAQAFYADVKQRAAGFGRDPDTVRVLPGVAVYVADTIEEANAKFDHMQKVIPVEYAMSQLEVMFQQSFSEYPLDGPIPIHQPSYARPNPEQSGTKLYREQGLTLEQYARRIAATKQHRVLVGTPAQVVDELELWFRNGAADGYMVLSPYIPGALQDFADMVVPELRRRKLFREDYTGRTLRDNLMSAIGAGQPTA